MEVRNLDNPDNNLDNKRVAVHELSGHYIEYK